MKTNNICRSDNSIIKPAILSQILKRMPKGSLMAHPKLMRRFFNENISKRLESDVVRGYVKEIGSYLIKYARMNEWLSEQVIYTLLFPQDILGMQLSEPYEIGARDSEILDILKIDDASRKEIYRFIFFHGLSREYDAIEYASMALIEIEIKNSNNELDALNSVRLSEAKALLKALLMTKSSFNFTMGNKKG